MSYPFLLILITVNICGIAIGAVLLSKPALAINVQKKFYEKINWRIEPINRLKEIRNTRIMGLILVASGLLASIYLVMNF